ncbi:hypothetical protein RRG08_018436 [Elysia crispata]|uniref:Uncharacterized protein n=1 Tax=Elysia crispata TaxID=231223 RepID=A0AAE0YTF6_9GAST|nr:hypothetical protein RRG08_018436 [Elysia crispata]
MFRHTQVLWLRHRGVSLGTVLRPKRTQGSSLSKIGLEGDLKAVPLMSCGNIPLSRLIVGGVEQVSMVASATAVVETDGVYLVLNAVCWNGE